MPGRLEFDVRFGSRGRPRGDEEPMRLLVLGDFCGSPAAERPPLASRPAQRVDIEDLDAVMRRLAPRLSPAFGEMSFATMDDFHPDRLYGRLTLFQALRDARTNPPADTSDLLDRLLGTRGEPDARPAAAGGIEGFIRDLVAPHIVTGPSARDEAHVAAVDAAVAEQMRLLLHDPAFQSLEAAWRGVHWLISGLELDETLQVHLFDVTRDELQADIEAAGGRPGETGLHRAMVERGRNVPGGVGWSALVSLLQFGPSEADTTLLGALGAIASQAGGPLLAGADPSLAGPAGDTLSAWQALRRSGAAPWIGLAAPRVLLRLPYGKASDAIDSFAFEEIVGLPSPEHLLWGNGSLAAALLIGRAFSARGWEMEPGDERELADMPAYTFVRDGERVLQPCAERFLTEREIQTMLDGGLIPLASRRDRNAVVAIRFQSIAHPPAPLAW